MATPDDLAAAIDTYIERFRAGDSAAWVACFAEDATHEDPVGTEPHHGRAAIQASYEQSLAIGGSLGLRARDEPIIVGNEAVVALEAWSGSGADRVHMPRIIDHFTFDDDARITSVRAFWQLETVRPDPE
jgi:steroid Delta-isomerase